MASALAYLHDQDILHRDIKPENVMVLDEAGPQGELQGKLLDFGLSKILGQGFASRCHSAVGTVNYVAPEINELRKNPCEGGEGYGSAVDMYSLGVTMYVMLASRFPDFNEGPGGSKEVVFRPEVWKNVSATAKDLISQLMSFSPSARPTAAMVLSHPWILNEVEITSLDHNSKKMRVEASNDEAQDIISPSNGHTSVMPAQPVRETSPTNLQARLRLGWLAAVQCHLNDAAKRAEAAASSLDSTSTCAGALEAARCATLLCREQIHHTATLLKRVTSISEQVLETIDDLELAVEEGHAAIARSFFANIARWAGELRTEAQTTQQQLRKGILDLWTHARPVFGAPLTLAAQADASAIAKQMKSMVVKSVVGNAAQSEEVRETKLDDDGPLRALEPFVPLAFDTCENATTLRGPDRQDSSQQDAHGEIAEAGSPALDRTCSTWSASHQKPADPAMAAVVQILAHMEQVDGILESICSFWGDAEALLAAQLKKSEHMESFLAATDMSVKLKQRFQERLQQVRLFWVHSRDASENFQKVIDGIGQPYAQLPKSF